MLDGAHTGHDLVETIAAVIVVVGGAILTAISFFTRPARNGPGASVPPPRVDPDAMPAVRHSLTTMAVGLSAGAAVIHLVAAPDHYLELGDLGAGFLAAAAFQGWWAVRAHGDLSRRLVDLGIVVNLAIIAAWAWSRTVGLPVGPFVGGPEPVSFPDAVCTAFEAGLVGLLVVLRSGLDPVLAGRAWVRPAASIAVVPILGLVLVLTSMSTAAIADGLDHGGPAPAPGGHVASH